MKYEAVFFDFDGVLADTEPVHFACWAEAMRPLGIGLDWETYRDHCIGLPARTLVQFIAQRNARAFEPLWAQYLLKLRLFGQRMLEDPPISRDTIDLLNSLPEYKLALVSSSTGSALRPILERTGIAACFSTAVFVEDVERHKPAPDPYLLAARRVGVETALVVEDSAAGIASGRAAGFDVLHIPEVRRMPELVRARLFGSLR